MHSTVRFLSFILVTAFTSAPALAAMPDSDSCSSTELLASFPNDAELDVSLDADAAEEAAAIGICPSKWYCDETGHFYGTRTQCQNACGSTACYRDYDCSSGLHCICP